MIIYDIFSGMRGSRWSTQGRFESREEVEGVFKDQISEDGTISIEVLINGKRHFAETVYSIDDVMCAYDKWVDNNKPFEIQK